MNEENLDVGDGFASHLMSTASSNIYHQLTGETLRDQFNAMLDRQSQGYITNEPIPVFNPDVFRNPVQWNTIENNPVDEIFITPNQLNNFTNINMADNTVDGLVKPQELEKPVETKTIVISELIKDLENGLTRLKGDDGYNEKIGSVEEKYNLPKAEVRDIFTHSALKGLRVKKVVEKSYVLVDDTKAGEQTTTVSAENAFGKASETTKKEIEKSTEVKTESVDKPF